MLLNFTQQLSDETVKSFAESFVIFRIPGESDEAYIQRVRKIIKLSDKTLSLFSGADVMTINVMETLCLLMSKSLSNFDSEFIEAWATKLKEQSEFVRKINEENEDQEHD